MAKRFIDTSFYKSPFVRGLKGSLKGLYSFIICDCDGSGIWAADFEIASVYIGQEITKNDFENGFLKTGKAVDLKNGKYFFPDFIQHQYPKGLSEKNPAQINIILELKKYNLLDENLKVVESPFEGTKVMVKEKDTVMVKEKVIPTETEFLDHCKEILQIKYPSLEFSLKSKYKTWFDDGWKTGHNKPIKNWKNTINNTIPHLKPIQNGSSTSENRNERVNSVKNLKNLSEKILDEYESQNSDTGS